MQKTITSLLIGLIVFFFTSVVNARILDGMEVSKHLSIPCKYGNAEVFIHGYTRDKDFMTKVENVMLTDAVRLFDYFKVTLQDPLHIVIESEIHQANGMATGIPKNKMILYTYPPDADGLLLASDDWIRTLVLHELTHIIQADMTTGFLGGMRDIFGSIFKWNLFTPRWFSEGSAVWAETHFTEGGRNRYVMNDLQLDRFLLDPRSCSDISCLDEGEIYPYNGLAYSLGGKFMEYMENNRPGTIRCLMLENSDNIPFILNNAFEACTTQEIDRAFERFILEYRANLMETQKKFSYLPWAQEAVRLKGVGRGELVFDQGMEIIDNQLVFASYDHRIDYLNRFDLDTKSNQTIRLANKLDSIPAPTKAGRLHHRYLFGLYDFDGEDVTRTWQLVDQKMQEVTLLEEDTPSSYLFWLGEKNYLSLRYKDNTWRLADAEGEFYQLEKFRTLARPFVETIGEQSFLIFKSYYRGKFSLQVIELDTKTRKNLYLSDKPFNLVGHYEGSILINRTSDESDKLLVLGLRQQSYVSKIEKSNELARVIFSDKKVVYAHRRDPNGLYLYKGVPEQFMAWLRSESSNYQAPKFLEVDHAADVMAHAASFESYPKLKYFKPDYWFFNGIYSGVQQETAVYTSISDPMENHQLDLKVIYYGKSSEVGGAFNYRYQIVDYTYLGVMGERFLHWSEAKEKSLSSETADLYLLANILSGRNTIPLILSYGIERERNSFSDQKEEVKNSTLGVQWQRIPKFFDNFINRFSLMGELVHRDGENLNYFTAAAQGQMRLYFHSRFSAYLKGMWERRYKEELTDGVSEFSQSFGPIAGTDLFGNRLSYGDLQFKVLANEVYRGWGNKPIFLRTISAIGGIEAIHAPYALIDDQLQKDQTYSNVYAGLDFATRFGYMFDFSLAPVWGVLLNNGEKSFTLRVVGEF